MVAVIFDCALKISKMFWILRVFMGLFWHSLEVFGFKKLLVLTIRINNLTILNRRGYYLTELVIEYGFNYKNTQTFYSNNETYRMKIPNII